MKRLVALVIVALMLLGVPLSGISDTSASVATSVPDTANVTNEAEISNASATATITITMTGAPNE